MDIDLRQKKVLVTREKKQASVFAQQIEQAHGEALIADVLKIECMQTKIRSFAEFDWIFFTSANGVHCFFQNVQCQLHHNKFAAVGPKTNEVLNMYGYSADFMPSIYNAETMADEFLTEYGIEPTVLFVRGTLAREDLIHAFRLAGARFTCLDVYKTGINTSMREKLNSILQTTQIDYLTFTSPSTVDAFVEMSDLPDAARQCVAVCIGTTTEQRAREQGFLNRLVPDEFTIEGMLQVMNEDIEKRG